jgi:hypothetical protein
MRDSQKPDITDQICAFNSSLEKYSSKTSIYLLIIVSYNRIDFANICRNQQ